MVRRARTLFGVVALLGVAACSESALQTEEDPPVPVFALGASDVEQVVPGDVVVKVKAGVDAAAVARGYGLAVAEAGYRGAFHVMRGAAGSERALAARLGGDDRVEWAEPNYLRQPHTIDGRLWAFYNPGGLNMLYTSGKNSGKPIGASYASIADADEDNIGGYGSGGAPVVIGSIDTGVDLTHPELAGRVIAGRDWYNGDDDPTDDDGHGTHTSATMAGTNVGVAGVAGAATNVRVFAQKVCGRRGCPSAAIASAITAAAEYPGMVAMNLSLGGSSISTAEKNAIDYAASRNVVVIASAGNSGSGTVSFPAAYEPAIAVAATTWRDEKASYSQYGEGLDIAAPGGQCYSNTTPEGCIYSAYKNGGYRWMQGTSMAAPQVTGTAAVVASVTGLRGSALRSRLLSTTDDKGTAGYDTTFGSGRLNSYRAVTGSTLPSPQ